MSSDAPKHLPQRTPLSIEVHRAMFVKSVQSFIITQIAHESLEIKTDSPVAEPREEKRFLLEFCKSSDFIRAIIISDEDIKIDMEEAAGFSGNRVAASSLYFGLYDVEDDPETSAVIRARLALLRTGSVTTLIEHKVAMQDLISGTIHFEKEFNLNKPSIMVAIPKFSNISRAF